MRLPDDFQTQTESDAVKEEKTTSSRNLGSRALSELKSADRERKKFLLITAGVVVLAVLTGFILNLFLRPDPDPEVASRIDITKEDRAQIDPMIREFMATSGNWGLNQNKLNESNIVDARVSIVNSSSGAESFWRSRSYTYQLLRKNYLTNYSAMDVSPQEYERWTDSEEMTGLSSFSVKIDSVTTKDEGAQIFTGGQNRRVATSTVIYRSNEKRYRQTVDDVTWDGTFQILESESPQTIQIRSIEASPGQWRVYDSDATEDDYTLAFWNPNNKDYYNSRDFTPVGTIKGKK